MTTYAYKWKYQELKAHAQDTDTSYYEVEVWQVESRKYTCRAFFTLGLFSGKTPILNLKITIIRIIIIIYNYMYIISIRIMPAIVINY